MSVDKKQYSHTNRAGVTYYLFSKEVTLRGGKKHLIYFFKHDPNEHKGITGWANKIYDLPPQFKVQENPRNGFLTVVRKNRTRNFAEDEED